MPTFDYICEVCGHEGREWRQDKPPRFCSRKCASKGINRKRPGRWPITSEMHERIRGVYQGGTGKNQVNELAKELGYPRCKISTYASRQGWVAKTHKEPDWTDEELKILERWAHQSPDRIRIKMKKKGFSRSVTGIVLKRRRTRLLQSLKGQSARSVAMCFGVDDKVVARWIKKGFLKAKKRGTERTERQGGDHWYIKDKWIRDFIVNYVMEIDFRKLDKYWFVDLLAGGNDYGTGAMRQRASSVAEAMEDREGETIDTLDTLEEEEEGIDEVDPDILEVFEEAANW